MGYMLRVTDEFIGISYYFGIIENVELYSKYIFLLEYFVTDYFSCIHYTSMALHRDCAIILKILEMLITW